MISYILENIFVKGISVIYGRPGTGKSRIIYMFTDTFKENTLLVTKSINSIEIGNIDKDCFITNVTNIEHIIRIANILKVKYILIDDILASENKNVISQYMRRIRDQSQYTKFIITTQVRQDLNSGNIYPHRLKFLLTQSDDVETFEFIKVREIEDITEIMIRSKQRGNITTIPINRNGKISIDTLKKYFSLLGINNNEIMYNRIKNNLIYRKEGSFSW